MEMQTLFLAASIPIVAFVTSTFTDWLIHCMKPGHVFYFFKRWIFLHRLKVKSRQVQLNVPEIKKSFEAITDEESGNTVFNSWAALDPWFNWIHCAICLSTRVVLIATPFVYFLIASNFRTMEFILYLLGNVGVGHWAIKKT